MTTDLAKKFFDDHIQVFSSYQATLRQLYSRMDAQYEAVAQSYGFVCTGCADSCCETRFYHHTYAEYLYLLEGFFSLNPDMQKQIRKKALAVCREQTTPDHTPVRVMCPANIDGWCGVYAHRPMICRLHGIPHELQKPGRGVSHGPGCGLFSRQCETMTYKKFDRTPFYRQMAILEKDLRQSMNDAGKLKMTIAQMLVGT